MTSQQVLDAAFSRATLDALDPEVHALALADELPNDIEARDAALGRSLHAIDALTQRAMRLLLDGVGWETPTRNVFAQTILQYANNLDLLSQRAQDAAARARLADPATMAADTVAAATRALAIRDAVRAPVLTLIAVRSLNSVVDADKRARDQALPEPMRKKWSAIRRELEMVARDPGRVAGSLAQRLLSHPDQLDEPEPSREPSLAELIELD